MASGSKLLEKLRRSPGGHGQRLYRRLLESYGFERSEQKSHTVYRYELDDEVVVVIVPRSNDIRGHVARKAITAIDLVVARQSE